MNSTYWFWYVLYHSSLNKAHNHVTLLYPSTLSLCRLKYAIAPFDALQIKVMLGHLISLPR